MKVMTYVQAQLYAHARNVIARINEAGTRVWFYTGDEAKKSTWLEIGAATVRDGTIDAHMVCMICDKKAQGEGAALSADEMKAQGARCGCRGTDDYCTCQNVPDRTTLAKREG